MTFNESILKASREHAEREFPRESCGLVVGDRYVECENIAGDPEKEFRIPRKTLVEFSGEITAVIHSHPNGPYYPSESDMKGQIDSGIPWGIVYVHDGVAKDPFFWGDSLPIAPLVGRNFQHGISDCYSLVRDYYRVNNIVTLPEIPRDWEWWKKPGFDLYRQNLQPQGFKIIDPSEVKEGDGFVARIRSKVLNHAGIYIGNGLILHQIGTTAGYNETNLSCRQPVNTWSRFIVHWLRYSPND